MRTIGEHPAAATAQTGPVLGIDPGLQRTGFAILSAGRAGAEATILDAGVIRLSSRAGLAERLAELAASLDTVIRASKPTTLVCEELYAHYKHPRTAILMGHARGVVLLLGAQWNMGYLPVSATRVKKTLTGSGHAGKAQMQRAVAATLRLPKLPEPADVADAIAIALCGLRLRAGAARAGTALRSAGGMR